MSLNLLLPFSDGCPSYTHVINRQLYTSVIGCLEFNQWGHTNTSFPGFLHSFQFVDLLLSLLKNRVVATITYYQYICSFFHESAGILCSCRFTHFSFLFTSVYFTLTYVD